MGITLQTNQREQAGSDVYNRYEYQVHWIVCQIISRLNSNPDCIVFCEFIIFKKFAIFPCLFNQLLLHIAVDY